MKQVKSFITKNKKPLIITCIVLLVAIIALIVCMVVNNGSNKKDITKNEEEISAITTEGIIKEETYKGLKFTNFTLIKKGTMYTLTSDVINETDSDIDLEQVYIDIKDKDGNVLGYFLGYIGDKMKAGETRTITASSSNDFSKAKTKTIREEK